MWKDLTLKEKAEIMKMSVANGVTDINDIQQLYDNSVGHRFKDAGRIRIITTSGNGYIPPIKQEAIIDAAFDYAIGNGKVPIDVVRKRLYDNLYPYSYTSPVTRVHNAVVNNKKEPRIVRNIPDRDDIFAEYLQIPENERHHLPGTMYVRDSEYAPTIGGSNNVKYKKLDLTDAQKEKIILATNSLNFGENRLSKIKHKFDEAKSKPRKYTDAQAAAMVLNSYFGEYTLGKGLDPQKGEYRSYYDLWDLSPVSTYGKDETRGIGKPVPFYDRIYLSDYYGVEPQSLLPYKGDYFGKWLPELVVTNKKALGGHLYKNAGPMWSHDPASMIEHFEGFRESPYRDGTAWSVGYGQYKNGYGANLDWDVLLSGKKKLTRSEAHQQVLRTVEDLKKKLKNTLGEKLYNNLTPGQLMGYLDTGYQRPASMISAAKVHKNKGAAAAASVLGVNGFADRNAARRAAFTGNWDNYTERGNKEYTPNKSTGEDYSRQVLNRYEAPAFQPITLSSANISSPWMDYLSKISQQPAVSFNTPIGTSKAKPSAVLNRPMAFSIPSFENTTRPEVMENVAQLPQYQSILNSTLFNDPYLLFRNA